MNFNRYLPIPILRPISSHNVKLTKLSMLENFTAYLTNKAENSFFSDEIIFLVYIYIANHNVIYIVLEQCIDLKYYIVLQCYIDSDVMEFISNEQFFFFFLAVKYIVYNKIKFYMMYCIKYIFLILYFVSLYSNIWIARGTR